MHVFFLIFAHIPFTDQCLTLSKGKPTGDFNVIEIYTIIKEVEQRIKLRRFHVS